MAAPRAPQDHKTKAAPAEPRAQASLVELVSEEIDGTELDAIPLFSIDGETYSMPATVSAATSLKALDIARRQGQAESISWVLEEVIGSEGYNALMNFKSLKPSQLQAIITVVTGHVMGSMEELTGN